MAIVPSARGRMPSSGKIDIRFFREGEEIEKLEEGKRDEALFSAPPPAAAKVTTFVPQTDEDEIVPVDTSAAGIDIWDAVSSRRAQVSEPPVRRLPPDGQMYEQDEDGNIVPHKAIEEYETTPYGYAYLQQLLQTQLEQEQNAVYQFTSLLDGHLKGRTSSAQTLSSSWISGGGGTGAAAISFIFQNLLPASTGTTSGGVRSIVDTTKVMTATKKQLELGLEAAAGKKAADASGLTTEAGRIAAIHALDGTRQRAIDMAERAVKVVNAAKDLPDPLVGNIVKEVVGLGNSALAAPYVGTPTGGGSVPSRPIVALSDIPIPKGAIPPPGPPTAKTGTLPVTVVANNREEVALGLAKELATNAEYQLYSMMQGNPNETKFKMWKLLYKGDEQYPRSLTSVAKDLEAVRTIERILSGASGAIAKGTPELAALAHYSSVENTGFLFINDSARAAIVRAYDNICYTHGNQEIPLISFMTQKAVYGRFAEYVAWIYHNPPGVSVPRGGGSVATAIRTDDHIAALGLWLSNCRMQGDTIIVPGFDPVQASMRSKREEHIQQHLSETGSYPTGIYAKPTKKIRTLGDQRRELEQRQRSAAVKLLLAKGSTT